MIILVDPETHMIVENVIETDNYNKIEVELVPEGCKWFKNGKFYKHLPELVEGKLKQLSDTDAQLIRLIEDLVLFCEGLGFEIPESKKNLIAYRNELRRYL